MKAEEISPITPRSCLAIIMGGGAGTRLFPLTKDRSKPAVPLAGKYRLVDIPISNCINSGIRNAYVLTQFNSHSLNRHITQAYKFDHFSTGFVEILAAQQTPEGKNWYQGTADAVRQNLRYFLEGDYDYYLILSGDQLYKMDFRDLFAQHEAMGTDISVATLPVPAEQAKSFGIMRNDENGFITEFVEKPKDPAVLDKLKLSADFKKKHKFDLEGESFLASMGIYLFTRDALVDCLDNTYEDFGKHVIPYAIGKYKVASYLFQGYWEDIGTIGSFFQANLDLCKLVPSYDFFDRRSPIYTNARFLPASKINGANIAQALISDGCIISNATIVNSIVGVRSLIETGSFIKDSVIMGADFYESDLAAYHRKPVPLGVGRNCRIEHAILDKNVRIGNNVVITPSGKPENMDGENFCIRDGVVVIPKGAMIPDDTWI